MALDKGKGKAVDSDSEGSSSGYISDSDSDSEEEITQEYLDSLLQKARESAIVAAEADDQEVIQLGESSSHKCGATFCTMLKVLMDFEQTITRA